MIKEISIPIIAITAADENKRRFDPDFNSCSFFNNNHDIKITNPIKPKYTSQNPLNKIGKIKLHTIPPRTPPNEIIR